MDLFRSDIFSRVDNGRHLYYTSNLNNPNTNNQRRETMNPELEFARKTALAYNVICKPLCQELNLPQTAFDILMFLGNNPAYRTRPATSWKSAISRRIWSRSTWTGWCEEGYLPAQAVPRATAAKTELICTPNWRSPSSERGQELQRAFFRAAARKIPDEENRGQAFCRCDRNYRTQFRRDIWRRQTDMNLLY